MHSLVGHAMLATAAMRRHDGYTSAMRSKDFNTLERFDSPKPHVPKSDQIGRLYYNEVQTTGQLPNIHFGPAPQIDPVPMPAVLCNQALRTSAIGPKVEANTSSWPRVGLSWGPSMHRKHCPDLSLPSKRSVMDACKDQLLIS